LSSEVFSGERISHAIWDLAEVNASKDLEEENGFWADGIWNLRQETKWLADIMLPGRPPHLGWEMWWYIG
jgi:hypothetical protein